MELVNLYTYSIPSTALEVEPSFRSTPDVTLEFSGYTLGSVEEDDTDEADENSDEQYVEVRVRFTRVRALRYRAESHCKVFHIEAFDKICEVIDSDWAQQIQADSLVHIRKQFVFRHLMTYLDGFGCLEVLCSGFEVKEKVRPEGPDQ